jgi:hypothetical protein
MHHEQFGLPRFEEHRPSATAQARSPKILSRCPFARQISLRIVKRLPSRRVWDFASSGIDYCLRSALGFGNISRLARQSRLARPHSHPSSFISGPGGLAVGAAAFLPTPSPLRPRSVAKTHVSKQTWPLRSIKTIFNGNERNRRGAATQCRLNRFRERLAAMCVVEPTAIAAKRNCFVDDRTCRLLF